MTISWVTGVGILSFRRQNLRIEEYYAIIQEYYSFETIFGTKSLIQLLSYFRKWEKKTLTLAKARIIRFFLAFNIPQP